MSQDEPTGELFSRMYMRPPAPLKDSQKIRLRLLAEAKKYTSHRTFGPILISYLRREGGLDVYGNPTLFRKFFCTAPIADILDSVTLVWQHLAHYYESEAAEEWRKFVTRVFSGEAGAYRVDSHCGVHPLVDADFQTSRASTLKHLGASRYDNVRASYEAAFGHQSAGHKKEAVRSMFDAVESAFKLLTGAPVLTKREVQSKLSGQLDRLYSTDAAALAVSGRIRENLAVWADSWHNYRHGSDQESRVEPPDEVVEYVLGSGPNLLRWLLELDQASMPE